MKEKFEVIEIENQTIRLKDNCSSGRYSCSASSGCGIAILAKYFDHYSVSNQSLQNDMVIGDIPILGISSKKLFYYAFQLYMLPLFVLFSGGLLGSVIYPEHEAGQIILAFIGFSASLLLTKYFVKQNFKAF